MSQWVSGFSHIIREESNPETKNLILDYLADLMEDSHDFGWNAAKGCHAVLLVKMEEGKIDWSDTEKIDRVRRIHAQRSTQNHTQSVNSRNQNREKPTPCKFYQRGTCGQKTDHQNKGHTYLHICSQCFANGKTNLHPSKDCKRFSKNEPGTA